MSNNLDKEKIDFENESILKYEQVIDANQRILIIKNCTPDDFTTYMVKA